MDSEGPTPVGDTGGMAALRVAEAHLKTLLAATDALDSKATFILAVNVVLFGVFFGAVISATDPTDWVALSAPAILNTLLFLAGGWSIRPRELNQFVRPQDLLEHRGEAYSSNQFAWSYVVSISLACESVNGLLDAKARGIGLLAAGAILHIAAIGVSAAVWIPCGNAAPET